MEHVLNSLTSDPAGIEREIIFFLIQVKAFNKCYYNSILIVGTI